jgi:hypothetical protein
MPTVSGTLGLPVVIVRPKRNSFHAWIAVKMATAARPGHTSSSMMEYKTRTSLALSISAASPSAPGSLDEVRRRSWKRLPSTTSAPKQRTGPARIQANQRPYPAFHRFDAERRASRR